MKTSLKILRPPLIRLQGNIRLYAVVLSLVILSLIMPHHVLGDTIRLRGHQWMPFTGEPDAPLSGYMVDILRAVFIAKGYNIEYDLMPLKRAVYETRQGRIDGVIGIRRFDPHGLVFPDEELGAIENVFFIRQGDPWRFVGINSFTSQKLGLIAGYSYGPEISSYVEANPKSDLINLIAGENIPERSLRMLLMNRLDILVDTPQVIRWAEKVAGIDPGKVRSRGRLGLEQPVYVAFSEKNPHAKTYGAIFSDGIRELRESGRLQSILKRYNQRDWKPKLSERKKMNLTFGHVAQPLSLDPARPTDLHSFIVIRQIFEGLVQYADDSTEIVPALAEKWETPDEGLTWLFHLHRGVRFHDGTPFNAKAVTFSFNRQIDPTHPEFRKDFGYAGFTFQNVKKVEALDDDTVQITLDHPYTPFLSNLAMPAASIVSPQALSKYGKEFGKHPVGTGPFTFSSWEPGKRLTLKGNPDYWNGPPYLNTLIYKVIDYTQGIEQELITHRVDMLGGIGIQSALEIEKDLESSLIMAPVMHVKYLMMNTQKPPFDRVQVRQAINHAIDKQNLGDTILEGFTIIAKTAIPPSMWGHHAGIEDYAFNPSTAKALLAEAGLPSGFDATLTYRSNTDNQRIVEAIQKNLAVVGINVVLNPTERKDYFPLVKNGEHEMALGNWIGDNGDPDNFLYVLFDYDNAVKGKATNRAFYRNEVLHTLLIKAQRSQDKMERERLYKDAQQIIHADAPWVPLYHIQMILGCNHHVRGVIPHPTGVVKFYRTWIEKQ